MNASRCDHRKLVDGHFGSGLPPARERELREHLVGCSTCQAYYERHLLLAKLDPAAPSAEDRLARGLGFSTRKPTWLSPSVAIPLGLAATAAALLLVAGPVRAPGTDGFAARGGAAAVPAVDVRVYRVGASGRAHSVVGDIAPDSELAFSYANRAAKKYLMIYGMDEHRHIYWFYPGWIDAAQDPAAIPVDPSTGQKELPEAVKQKLDGEMLHLHALFLDEPQTVKQVEAQIAASGNPARFAGALVWSRDLRVSPR